MADGLLPPDKGRQDPSRLHSVAVPTARRSVRFGLSRSPAAILISSIGLLTAGGWFLQTFFGVRGVNSVALSRWLLFGVWACGFGVISLVTLRLTQKPLFRSIVLVVSGIVLTGLMFWLDAWAPKPKAEATRTASIEQAPVLVLGKGTTARMPQSSAEPLPTPPKNVALSTRKASDEGSSLRLLTNRQLKAKSLFVAAKMKTFERTMQDKVALVSSGIVFANGKRASPNEESRKVYADEITIYNNTLLPDAIALRAELWRRVGSISPDRTMGAFDAQNTDIASVNRYEHPISDAAEYLENLAAHLK